MNETPEDLIGNRFPSLPQVEEGGRASRAGVKDGDEMVSLNGEPCADLSLPQALHLLDASADRLQLLFKR